MQWATETTAPTEGGAAPYGTALASIAATITATDLEAKRYGASAIVHVRTIEREAIFERFVGTIMRRALLVALERGCLVGAGAPNQIEGLTNRTTITSLARGTDSRFVGLVKAVEALTGAGFGPELVACFSPATWRDIVTDGSPNLGQLLAQVLPDLRLIVAPSLPAGAGVIGSLETTSLVRDAPPVLEISRDHSDVFTRSEAAVRLEGRFELVAAPEGWRRLTGY